MSSRHMQKIRYSPLPLSKIPTLSTPSWARAACVNSGMKGSSTEARSRTSPAQAEMYPAAASGSFLYATQISVSYIEVRIYYFW